MHESTQAPPSNHATKAETAPSAATLTAAGIAKREDGASAGGDARRWHVLAAGFAANAAFSAAISGLPAAAVLVRDGYGLSTSGLGLALGAVGLGIAVSELPWGLLTDRLGDRRVLLSGLGLTAAVLAWMAVFVAPAPGSVPSSAYLVTCMGLLGLAGGSVNGSSGRAVMSWFTDRERGLAMSIRQTALPAGGAIGAVAVPAMAASGGFRPTYAMLAAACVAATAFSWAVLRSSPSRNLATRPSSIAGPTRSPLGQWQVWRIALGIGALCVAQIAVLSFLAVFLHDLAGFGLTATSAAMVAYQVGAAALRVWSGAWTDRHANRPGFLRRCSLVTAAIFCALAMLSAMTSVAPGAALKWALLLTLVCGGMVASCWHGVAYTELAVRAGPAHVGTALGLGNTLAFGSYFITPLMVPAVLAASGWPAAWWVVAAFALGALPLFPRPALDAPRS